MALICLRRGLTSQPAGFFTSIDMFCLKLLIVGGQIQELSSFI